MFQIKILSFIIFSIVLNSSFKSIVCKEKLVVCYTTNWSQYRLGDAKFFPENIDPFLCTHIVYAFAKLSGNNLEAYEWNDESTDWSQGLYARTIALKKQNPNLKVLIGVGGWNHGSGPFSLMVHNETSRKAFIKSSVEFLTRNKFDGLDLDWEYPGSRPGSRASDKYFLTILLRELKKEYKKHDLLLTAAVSAGKKYIDDGYEISQINQYLDFVSLMAYDFHGSWETRTGHHSPLFPRHGEGIDAVSLNADWAVNYWLNNGFSRDKLVMGIPTYGRSFLLANPNNYELDALATSAGKAGPFTKESGFLSYYEVCDLLKEGYTKETIEGHQVPIAYKEKNWVGFDDLDSVIIKSKYILEKGLAGAMIWSLDLDDFTGTHCGQGKYPLITAIKQTLDNSVVTNIYSYAEKTKDSKPNNYKKVTKPINQIKSSTEQTTAKIIHYESNQENSHENNIKYKQNLAVNKETEPNFETNEKFVTDSVPLPKSAIQIENSNEMENVMISTTTIKPAKYKIKNKEFQSFQNKPQPKQYQSFRKQQLPQIQEEKEEYDEIIKGQSNKATQLEELKPKIKIRKNQDQLINTPIITEELEQQIKIKQPRIIAKSSAPKLPDSNIDIQMQDEQKSNIQMMPSIQLENFQELPHKIERSREKLSIIPERIYRQEEDQGVRQQNLVLSEEQVKVEPTQTHAVTFDEKKPNMLEQMRTQKQSKISIPSYQDQQDEMTIRAQMQINKQEEEERILNQLKNRQQSIMRMSQAKSMDQQESTLPQLNQQLELSNLPEENVMDFQDIKSKSIQQQFIQNLKPKNKNLFIINQINNKLKSSNAESKNSYNQIKSRDENNKVSENAPMPLEIQFEQPSIQVQSPEPFEQQKPELRINFEKQEQQQQQQILIPSQMQVRMQQQQQSGTETQSKPSLIITQQPVVATSSFKDQNNIEKNQIQNQYDLKEKQKNLYIVKFINEQKKLKEEKNKLKAQESSPIIRKEKNVFRNPQSYNMMQPKVNNQIISTFELAPVFTTISSKIADNVPVATKSTQSQYNTNNQNDENIIRSRLLESFLNGFTDNYTCTKDGLFADKSSGCIIFYDCIWSGSNFFGKKFKKICPPNTVFNQELLVCDWESNVEC